MVVGIREQEGLGLGLGLLWWRRWWRGVDLGKVGDGEVWVGEVEV